MDRVAVFVDAGYLFAQGSAALSGSKKPRFSVRLNTQITVEFLREIAGVKSEGARLLRIYWYDGVPKHGPTSEHAAVAETENIKIRLGYINSSGQQKGVDSLIVTDMIELARNHAISDAVLLAGDEDLRVGVQIAQNYGVRVHLIGIIPSRGSQSALLIREADTKHEIDRDQIGRMMQIVPGLPTAHVVVPPQSPQVMSIEQPLAQSLASSVGAADFYSHGCAFATSLSGADFAMCQNHFGDYRTIPNVFDRRLLAATRDAVGRMLAAAERERLRQGFVDRLMDRTQDKSSVDKAV
ncbi:MAG TPA: NYN domain-containing protein [Acetobacteraceae bacterium]|nr:NYN domain-containing protein [Acetobacteraceae bacterium]